MNKQHKQLILTVLVVIIIASMMNTNLYPRVYLNKGGCAYEGETCDDGSGSTAGSSIAGIAGTTSSTINTNIILGAGYFLNSQSSALLFMNKIEMSDLAGLDYNDLRAALYNAIAQMELAVGTHSDLKQAAAITPYRASMIAGLKTFDYEAFQMANGLNTATFQVVENYLKEGDVTGLFGEMLTGTENILAQLYALQVTVEQDQIPSNQALWTLAQAYSQLHMTGQYAARVFYEVK
jgi:hypothetical protein